MFKFLVFIVLLFFSFNSFSQNLVLNGQLEIGADSLTPKNWSFPFNRSLQEVSPEVLFTLSEGHDPYHPHKRINYLQGQFSRRLSPDSTYYFEVLLKCNLHSKQRGDAFIFGGKPNSRDTSWVFRLVATNNLGLLVLPRKVTSNRVQDMPYIKEVKPDFNYCKMISEDGEWQKISGLFQPEVAGSHFFIGNFYSTAHTLFSVKAEERNSYFIRRQNLALTDVRIAQYFIKDILVRPARPDDLNDNCLSKEDELEVFFDFRESTISALQQKNIEQFLRMHKNSDFRLLGYTDTIGGFIDNIHLGYERAMRVKTLMDKISGSNPTSYVYGVGEAYNGESLELQRKVVIQPLRKRTINASEIYTPNPMSYDGKVINGWHPDSMDVIDCLNDFPYQRIRNNIADGYKPLEAAQAILSITNDADIVFFGEHHALVSNRKFLKNILQGLKAQGFKTLFVETLSKDIAKDQQYPKISDGYFSREPMFGNLLREAIKLGFDIKSYDPVMEEEYVSELALERAGFFAANPSKAGSFMEPDGTWKTLEDGVKGVTIRNHGEAVNILAKLDGKAIVFGGENHNHIMKCGPHTTAGYWLKQLSDKKLLSVSQTSYYYDSLSLSQEPVVLVKNHQFLGAERMCFETNSMLHTSDIAIFYPVGDFEVPLLAQEKKYRIKRKAAITYPALLSVYLKGENPKNAIPVFNQIVNNWKELSTLNIVLDEDDYFGLLRDSHSKIKKIGLVVKTP